MKRVFGLMGCLAISAGANAVPISFFSSDNAHGPSGFAFYNGKPAFMGDHSGRSQHETFYGWSAQSMHRSLDDLQPVGSAPDSSVL